MSENIQAWGSFTVDDAKEEQKAIDEMGQGKFHKMRDGKNKVRFLPAKRGGKTFIKVHQHFVKVGDMESAAAFNCPRRMSSQPCVVCNDAEILGATGSSTDYDLAGKLFAKFRVFANLIDREHPELGPLTFAFGKTVFESLVKIRADEDDGGDFTNPIDGFDIIITKTGSGLNTKYEVRPSQKGTTPLGDISSSWIEVQPDLGRYAKVPSQGELESILRNARYPSASKRLESGGGGQTAPKASKKNVASDLDDD